MSNRPNLTRATSSDPPIPSMLPIEAENADLPAQIKTIRRHRLIGDSIALIRWNAVWFFALAIGSSTVLATLTFGKSKYTEIPFLYCMILAAIQGVVVVAILRRTFGAEAKPTLKAATYALLIANSILIVAFSLLAGVFVPTKNLLELIALVLGSVVFISFVSCYFMLYQIPAYILGAVLGLLVARRNRLTAAYPHAVGDVDA